MAKGNLFLGLAAGSVGDVTMYRRNGNQISRARVRKVSNPKSQGQIYTRAILSTVAKAYSAGKAIFDHSFQGYAVPEGAQRRFLKLNLDALRSRVYDDVSQQTTAQYSAPLVGPNSPSPVAGEFIVSEGSLEQNFITITPATFDNAAEISFGTILPGDTTVGDVLDRYRLSPGDIFTIVLFAFGDLMAGLTPATKFAWTQFKLRDGVRGLSLGDASIGAIFETRTSANVYSEDISGFNLDEPLTLASAVRVSGIGLDTPGVVGLNGTFAIIRSREDSPLRSSAQMQWLVGDDHGGLGWSQVVDAWSDSLQLGESDLLLEGSEFPRQQPPFMTANFAQPTSVAALGSLGSPALTFREQVSFAELSSRLSVSGAGMSLTAGTSDNTLTLTDGTDSFAVLTLTSSGKSVEIRVTSMSGGPSGFSFVWQ